MTVFKGDAGPHFETSRKPFVGKGQRKEEASGFFKRRNMWTG
jgi:hypothetical protein